MAAAWRFLPENADVSMRVFQIGRDIDLVHGHQRPVESDFARE